MDFINQSVAIFAALACVSSKTSLSTPKTESREMKSTPRSTETAQAALASASSGDNSGGVPMPKASGRLSAGGVSSGSCNSPSRSSNAARTAVPAPMECPVKTNSKSGSMRNASRRTGSERSSTAWAARSMPSWVLPPHTGAVCAAASVNTARQSTVPRMATTSHLWLRSHATEKAGSKVRSPHEANSKSSDWSRAFLRKAAVCSGSLQAPALCAAAPPRKADTLSRCPSAIGPP
mmetsp:Transcript_61064/g.158648  ORF Transcript_61064/g.158648 Transcript_61064/m.158648 type:complete len:235 (+) Transcript_61064:295-999(+)